MKTLLLTIGVLLMISCTSTSDKMFSALEKEVLVKRSQMLMGTVVSVTAVAMDEETAQTAAAAGLAEIWRLEQLLSTWVSTSDLSRVNAMAGKEPVKVSRETFELIEWALVVAEMTENGFNVAIGPAVNVWGFPESPRLPAPEELEKVRPLIDLSAVLLDKEAGTIFLTRPGMSLDVGGIGKGYAADWAAQVMRDVGATAGVVALSGDIVTFGRMPNRERFVFGIQHPREQGVILAQLELEDEAVSTAGDYQRFFEKDGAYYHHILDPATLQPARACQSVTVVADDGVLADGLDTGIFVLGPKKGLDLVELFPGLEALIVDQKGEIHVSSGLKGRLTLASSPKTPK